MKKLLLAMVATAALAAVASDFPQVVYVSPTGSDSGDGTAENPYLSISNTLDLAGVAFAGDGVARTVVLAAGTYSASSQDFPAVVPNGVSLKGAGMGATILDAGNGNRTLLQVNGSTDAELSGVSLRNSKGWILKFSTWGGEVKDVEISGCTDNGSVNGGEGTLFYSNWGTSRHIVFSGLVMTNISYTTRHDDGKQPPRFLDVEGVGSAVFTNCVFRKFQTNWWPNGKGYSHFYICHQSGTGNVDYLGINALFVDTVFDDFVGTGSESNEGGTFYLGRPADEHRFERCVFRNFKYTGNYIKQNGSSVTRNGDEVFCAHSCYLNDGIEKRVILDNCLFENITFARASGVTRAGIVGGFRSITRVVNCTFHGCTNMAPIVATTTDRFNIYMYNSAVSDCERLTRGSYGSQVHLYNCNVYNTTTNGTYAANSGIITTDDPHFANAAAGNFHLSDSSTALINKGDNSYVTSWTTDLRDLDGKPRIHGKNGTVDIGCYEKAGLTGLVVLVR